MTKKVTLSKSYIQAQKFYRYIYTGIELNISLTV